MMRTLTSNPIRCTLAIRTCVIVAFGLLTISHISVSSAQASESQDLAKRVVIRRTQYGVPHIQADTLEAAGFGFGYCQAEDHLPSIMRGIIGVRSGLAATFGPDDAPGDHKHLDADFFNRQFRVYKRAVDTYHKLDPDYRSMCEGFAAGLNYYVAKHREQAPAWTPEVTGHDVVAYGLAGVMRFAFNRHKILDDFLKEHGVKTAALDDESLYAEIGSNMWALAPSRSQSGRALLMGNPHQPWAPVSTYYEAHLIVPGKMNFYGSTFVGRPVLTSGWNERLGWSHTVNDPDLEEIYELTIDPAHTDHFQFDGSSLPLEREDVAIEYAAGDQKKISMHTYWHTPLGPVIHRTHDKIYVLRNACWENYRAYEQWLRMTQAKNLDEFRATLAMNQLPMFNICYADRVGNIYYLWNGTVPKLPHAAHKAQAVPASHSAEIWTDLLTTAELPQLLNPPGGYVQNCNSPPFLTTLRAPLDPAKFPPYLGANNVSLRSQHSLRLVDNDDKFTLSEVMHRKHSPDMLLAERVKGDLIAAVRSAPTTPELDSALTVLEAWDNTVAAESHGSTLFTNWWQRYVAAKGAHAVEWSAAEPTATPRGLADPALARQLFIEAVADVKQRYGALDVRWGDVHRLRKQGVDLPLSGGSGLMGCFRVLEFRQDADGKQVANSGDSFVFAVEFSDPPRGYTVLAYSQSEIPGTPHYADQAKLFAAGELKPAAFTEAEIEAQLLKRYHPGEE